MGVKNVVMPLAAAVFLSHAALLYAGEPKVMVSPFESKTGDEELAKRATIISAKEVMRSKDVIYVSPTDYIKAVIGGEKIVKKTSVDLEKEYEPKNLDELEEMCKPHQGKLDTMINALAAVDVAIGGNAERKGDTVKVEPTIVSVKYQKTYSAVVECEEGRLEDELRKAIRELLEKISKIEEIYADKLTDPKLSKVVYVVESTDRRKILIEMDYTGDRPAPQLQNVRIMPPEEIEKNGITVLKVKSLEGNVIDIEFKYNLGKLESVKVDTPMPDPLKEGEQFQRLTLKSKAGYLLVFEFAWKDGFMQSAKLYPKINPFGGNE